MYVSSFLSIVDDVAGFRLLPMYLMLLSTPPLLLTLLVMLPIVLMPRLLACAIAAVAVAFVLAFLPPFWMFVVSIVPLAATPT